MESLRKNLLKLLNPHLNQTKLVSCLNQPFLNFLLFLVFFFIFLAIRITDHSISFNVDVVSSTRKVEIVFPKFENGALFISRRKDQWDTLKLFSSPNRNFIQNLEATVSYVLVDIIKRAEEERKSNLKKKEKKEKVEIIHKTAEKEADELVKKKNDFVNEINALKRIIKDLEGKNLKSNKEMEQIKLKFIEKEKEMDKIRADNETLKKNMQQKNEEMERGKLELKKIVEKNEKMIIKVEEIPKLERKIAELEKVNNDTIKNLWNINQQIPVYKSEILHLKESNKTLNHSIDENKIITRSLKSRNDWLEQRYAFSEFLIKKLDTKLFESLRFRSVLHQEYLRLVQEKKISPKIERKEYKLILNKNHPLSEEFECCRWNFFKTEHKFEQGYTQEFQVDYFGDADFPVMSFWILPNEVYETSCVVIKKGGIKRGVTSLFGILVTYKSKLKMEDLRKTPFLELIIKEGDQQDNKTIATVKIVNYIDEIAVPTLGSYVPIEKNIWKTFNVLIFGVPGAGKSSFINSVHTLLNRSNDVIQISDVSSTGRHCTVDYSSYSIPFLRLKFFDVWGLSLINENYNSNDIEAIVLGALPIGWKMEREKNDMNDIKKSVKSMFERRIHAAVFMLPHSMLYFNEKGLKKIINSFQELSKYVKNIFLMISKIDTISKEFYSNPCDFENSEDANLIIKDVRNIFNGIPRSRILFGCNYVNSTRKKYFVDLLNFINCVKILDQAQQNELIMKNGILKEKENFEIEKFFPKKKKEKKE